MRLEVSRSFLLSLWLIAAGCEGSLTAGEETETDRDNIGDEAGDSRDDSDESSDSGDEGSTDSSSDEAGDGDDASGDDTDGTGGDDSDDASGDETGEDSGGDDSGDDSDDSGDDGSGDGDDSGDTGGDDTDDTGGDDSDDGSDPPDIYEPFTSLSAWHQELRSPGGRVDIASHPGADDSSVAALLFPGNPDLGVYDRTSPGFATEIVYPERFLYGKFETRVRFGGCREGDHDGDGLPDNSEIDIEQLCGTPEILWLTVYTDYRDFVAGGLKKRTRMVNMRTGSYLNFTDFPPVEGERGTLPGIAIPSFPQSDTFYTVGFEWRQGFVRYYIVLDGEEKDLFVLDEPDTVPQRSAQFLINIWHAPDHWDGSGTGDYPAQDSIMLVDSVKIWR
jgi:hypothetical protein